MLDASDIGTPAAVVQSWPVSTKPFASNATPHPWSHSVSGSAPTNRNTLRMGFVVSTFVLLFRHETDESPLSGTPSMPESSVSVCSSMFGIA